MDIACPFCKAPTPAEAVGCNGCGAKLLKRCPYCAEEIQILARRCRFCQSDLVVPGPADIPPIKMLRGSQGVGAEQHVLTDVVLSIVTCGLWSLAVIHRAGTDINRHAGREVVNPVMDLALTLATCGLWIIFVAYKYPTVLNDLERAEGLPGSDIMVICVVLAVVQLGPVSLLILQDQLNRHWRLHAERPVQPA